MLHLFIDVAYVLPDLIIGSLTRESVHRAIDKGISANEIHAFLERNAHKRMVERPAMPETVINQVILWAGERHRLQMNKAYLYEGFGSMDEYLATEKYTRDYSVFLFAWPHAEAHRCALAVRADAHAAIKKFIKDWRVKQAAAPGGQ